jgi:hypothetical protein
MHAWYVGKKGAIAILLISVMFLRVGIRVTAGGRGVYAATAAKWRHCGGLCWGKDDNKLLIGGVYVVVGAQGEVNSPFGNSFTKLRLAATILSSLTRARQATLHLNS